MESDSLHPANFEAHLVLGSSIPVLTVVDHEAPATVAGRQLRGVTKPSCRIDSPRRRASNPTATTDVADLTGTIAAYSLVRFKTGGEKIEDAAAKKK